MDMSTLRIVNCALESLCVLICAILLVQIQTIQMKRDTDFWFKVSLISVIGMLLGDMADWGLSGAVFPAARFMLTAGITLFYAASGFVMFGFFGFVNAYMSGKRPQPGKFFSILVVVTAFQVVIALISPLTGAVFSITEENVYSPGPLFILTQISPAVIFLISLWIYARTWTALNRKEKIYFGLYFTFPLLAEILQDACYGLATLPITLTLTFLLVSMFLHTEMDEQFHASEQQVEGEKILALQTIQHSQSELTNQIIIALSSSVEAKDRYTNGHSLRVAELRAGNRAPHGMDQGGTGKGILYGASSRRGKDSGSGYHYQ